MELVKFSSHLGGKDPTAPPFRIPARDLDNNFARLRPLSQDGNARQYAIEETPNGWFLKLFPDGTAALLQPPPEGTYVLGSVNGVVSWFPTQSC